MLCILAKDELMDQDVRGPGLGRSLSKGPPRRYWGTDSRRMQQQHRDSQMIVNDQQQVMESISDSTTDYPLAFNIILIDI